MILSLTITLGSSTHWERCFQRAYPIPAPGIICQGHGWSYTNLFRDLEQSKQNQRHSGKRDGDMTSTPQMYQSLNNILNRETQVLYLLHMTCGPVQMAMSSAHLLAIKLLHPLTNQLNTGSNHSNLCLLPLKVTIVVLTLHKCLINTIDHYNLHEKVSSLHRFTIWNLYLHLVWLVHIQ